MIVELASVPVETRAEAAWLRVCAGDDPYLMLHAALWPSSRVSLDSDGRAGYCRRGHPWTEENTYVRPGDGWRRCRACMRGDGVEIQPRIPQVSARHGTLSRYAGQKCRCDACRAANAEYRRSYRLRQRTRHAG